MVNDPHALADDADDLDRWIYDLARQFGHRDQDGVGADPLMSPGDRAALRRLALKPTTVADGAVIKLLTQAKVPMDRQRFDFDRWRLVAHAAAVLSGTGKQRAHSGKARFGAVLKEAGVSEQRLLRLLSARGTAMVDQVILLIRIVAQKRAHPTNLRTLYHLLSDRPAEAETARVRIAQDYYYAAAAARTKGEEASDD